MDLNKMKTTELEGKIYFVAYKVVTFDLKSLGLRKNPNVLQYPLDKWYVLPNLQIKGGKDDCGGIWCAVDLSNAKHLKKYMQKKYNQKTRIFKTAIGQVLYRNNYRVKTDKICLLEEIL
jgi:hypothetical protein